MKQQMMEVGAIIKGVSKDTGLPFLVCVLILVLSKFQGYLLFHTLAELFAIIVATLVSIVVWQTYRFSRNHYLMFLGCGYAWIAVIDLLHALSYKGMNIFPVDGSNTATQLWVSGRLFEASLLFIAPFFLGRAFSLMKVNLAFSALAIIALISIFTGLFPVTYVQGEGLTDFKVMAEFVAIGIFAAAIVHLLLRWKQFELKVMTLICLSIVTTIFSEFAFTLYTDVYGVTNFLGHILKFLSYWLIFQAIASTTLQEPIKVLHSSLTEENALRKQREEENNQLIAEMAERHKELKCMYEVTETVSRYEVKEALIAHVVELLPAGWQYPEYTEAEILFDGKAYSTFAEQPSSLWKQSSAIAVDGGVRGQVVIFYTKEFPERDEGPFLQQERALIDGIASSLGQGIAQIEAKEKIKHQATHDELTGLYNRKLIEQIIGKEITRASRYSRSFSLFMLDLDHFKDVNDQYGHQVGDLVLQQAAATIEEHVREVDHVGRYGGEEFLVTLPETTPAEAMHMAQRLVDAIAALTIPLSDGRVLSLTVSIGVAAFPDNAQSTQELIKAADMAMYKAKRDGRNRVACYFAE